MDLKSWANTLANRSQQLARDGLAYVNRQFDQGNNRLITGTSTLSSYSFIDLASFRTSSVLPSECDSSSSFGFLIRYSLNIPKDLTLEAEISEMNNGYFEMIDQDGNSSLIRIGTKLQDYFVDSANEIGVELSCQNVFTISELPPNQMLRFGAIRSQFPIDGNFIFRFKIECADETFSNYLWVDINNPTTPVPFYKGQVHMKVLLLPSYVDLSSLQNDEANDVVKLVEKEKTREVLSSPQNEKYQSSLLLTGELSIVNTEPLYNHASSETALDWLSLDEEIPKMNNFKDALRSPFWSKKKENAPVPPVGPIDVFARDGKTSIDKSESTAFGTNNLTRAELAQNREARKAERIAEKLQFAQQQREEEASRLQEKLAVTDAVREQLEKWSKDAGGGWKDIRTLLSSLSEVLWVDADWDPVPLSSLMVNESQVKKVYRKALLLSHPDKHQKAPAEQHLRAETIFQALNESFKISSL